MQDAEQAHRYLIMAEKDLKAVSGMKDDKVFPIEVFGFHVQQAIEKTLKAWLCFHGVNFPRIHDLDELALLLSDNEITIPQEYIHLLSFTDFAVTFRYDVYLDVEEEIDRDKICHDTNALHKYITAILSEG